MDVHTTLNTVIPLCLGATSHIAYFKHGEHHMYARFYFLGYIISFVALVIGTSHYSDLSILASLAYIIKASFWFLTGLFTSTFLYRQFLNPLNTFPGSPIARLTKFYLAFTIKNGNSHHTLLALHEKYGPYLRIGPNDLSITDPLAIDTVFGLKSVCLKAPWYDNDQPYTSLHTERVRATHDARRRIWAPAFSDRALRGYENRIRPFHEQLVSQISKREGQPMNVSKWFNLFSFDVMGELAFGKSYDMLASGENHPSLKILSEGMDHLGLSLPSWILRLLFTVGPYLGLAGQYFAFMDYCTKQFEERLGKTEKEESREDRDVMSYLIEHHLTLDEAKKRAQWPTLQNDSRLMIVAGSDTTAATMSHMFLYLAKEKGLVLKLRKEMDSLAKYNEKGKLEYQSIKEAPLLNGVINEALRLHPPVPSGWFRKTPPEGIMIGETFIPGDTHIQVPPFVVARSRSMALCFVYELTETDESIYTNADMFIPERWTTKPEFIRNDKVFMPFSIGPYGCIGKNLALLELRMATCGIISQFDVSFAPGEDGSNLVDKSIDHFTMGLGDLNLVFTKRKTS